MIKYFVLILFFASSALAAGKASSDNQLLKVSYEEKDGKTLVHFHTSKPAEQTGIEARFLRRSVEWDLAGLGMKKDKMFVDVGSNDINNVYVSYSDAKSVRVRVNLDNGKTASNYHERISFVSSEAGLTMMMDSSVKLITNNIKELNRVYEVAASSDKKIAEHLNKASVLQVGGTATAAAAAPEIKAGDETSTTAAASEEDNEIRLDDNKSEDQIPLKLQEKKADVGTSSALGRMVIGLVAIGFILASIVVISRKINRKRLGAQFSQDSITVVSQKYLGPKRNLTLVRVSGEYLLLGVTDNNISLIKTLAVVDDEIPALTPTDFGAAVKDMTKKSDDLEDMLGGVEDSFSVSSLGDVKKMFNKRKYIDE